MSRSDMRTLVVKIGTTLLSGPKGFDGRVLEGIVREVVELKRDLGLNVLLVSSGALGCGMGVLELKERPKLLPMKQAAAAVGQSRLMHYYEVLFETHGGGLKVAQVLLSGGDLDNRQSYLNIRNTLLALFDLKSVVPIVNENDSVATDELRFGDNDTLAAKVASKIDADLLIILSDIDGLYDCDPRTNPGAQLIERVESVTPAIEALAGDTRGSASTGGMKTKLAAAKIACSVGLPLVIANGRTPRVLHGILDGSARGTVFGAGHPSMPHRKRWIAFGRAAKGAIVVDDGARNALLVMGRSLLAAGILEVQGQFEMGASVHILDQPGQRIATGLVNYGSADIGRIKGRKTSEIQAILGQKDFDEVIHRDNLVILTPAAGGAQAG